MQVDKLTGKVYLIVNPRGAKYVGSTYRNVEKRWSEYYKIDCRHQPKIGKSLKKYGPENHTFSVIWEGSIELMLKMENILGIHHNVLDRVHGLNLNLPGYEDIVKMVSEETREKIGNARRGKKDSPETVAKRAASNTGKKRKPFSEEHRSKLSAKSKGRKMPERTQEHKDGISKGNKGKVISKEHREAISKALTGGKMPPSHKINTSKAKKGKKESPKSTERKYISVICNETNEVFKGIKHAAEHFGVGRTSISTIVRGINKKTKGGFSFKYYTESLK